LHANHIPNHKTLLILILIIFGGQACEKQVLYCSINDLMQFPTFSPERKEENSNIYLTKCHLEKKKGSKYKHFNAKHVNGFLFKYFKIELF
jgi:hypothetical protein